MVAGDLRREEAVENLRQATLRTFGTVDIVVNNAGVGKYGPLLDFTPADYDWIMDTNMRASFLVTRAFLPTLLEKGSGDLVFVASVAGSRGFPKKRFTAPASSPRWGLPRPWTTSFGKRGSG